MQVKSHVWLQMFTLSPDIGFSLILLTSLESTIFFVSFVSANKSKVHCAQLTIVTWNIQGKALELQNVVKMQIFWKVSL